jgi:hypothetical protein
MEGMLLYQSRRYDEAIAQPHRTLELDPAFLLLTTGSVQPTWSGAGRHAEAVAKLDTAVRLSGGRGSRGSPAYAYAYAIAGQRDRAREIARELTARSRHEYVTPDEFVLAYIGLGDTDQAFAWAERVADCAPPVCWGCGRSRALTLCARTRASRACSNEWAFVIGARLRDQVASSTSRCPRRPLHHRA